MTSSSNQLLRSDEIIVGRRIIHTTENGSMMIVFDLSPEAQRGLTVASLPSVCCLPVARIRVGWWRRLLVSFGL